MIDRISQANVQSMIETLRAYQTQSAGTTSTVNEPSTTKVGQPTFFDSVKNALDKVNEADVKAEGFASYEHFVQTWSYMHDAAACREADKLKGIHICGAARTRPAERYQAWAITFELVKESDHASK